MPEDRTAQADYSDASGWYEEPEWRSEQPRYGSDLGPPEPHPRAESDGLTDRRYEEARFDEPRYEEPARDPFRGDTGRGEPQRVEPPRPVDPPLPRASAARPRSTPPQPSAPPPPQPRLSASVPASPGPVGDNVYRSKRPAVAALFGIAAGLLEIPALALLHAGAFGDSASPAGAVSGACLVSGLPLAAVGLYAVATGAVRAAGPNSHQAWLRPPVAYLSVALVLFLTAGLAA